MLGTVLPMSAQKKQKQDALYIYRNDGGFMGFFYDDIERFEYSCIDTLGTVHDDFVVQEIYALDTLFRIPLSAIDSIAFVTPETVYKADVAHTATSDMWNYVIKQDSLTLFLASNTPSGMTPKVGEKLVFDEQNEILPAGFAGLVKAVSNGTEGIIVDCEQVSLLDVFDQFVSKARIEGSDSSQPLQARRRVGGDPPYHLDVPDISGSLALNNEFGFLPDVSFGGTGGIGYTIKNSFDWRAFLQVGLLTGLQFSSILHGKHDLTLSPNIGATMSISHDFPLSKGLVAAPGGPFLYFYRTMGIVLGATGSLYIEGNFNGIYSSYSLIQFNSQRDGQQQAVLNLKTLKPMSYDCTKVGGKISFTLGGFSEIDITCLCTDLDKAGVRMELGGRLDIGAEFQWSDLLIPLSDTKIYDLLNRDGSTRKYFFLNGQLIAHIFPWKTSIVKEITLGTPWEGGLVPNFSRPRMTIDAVSHDITTFTGLSRKTFTTQPVGFSLYNQNTGKHISTKWFESSYNGETEGKDFMSYNNTFPEMYGGQNVRFYPTVKLFNTFDIVGKPYMDLEIEPEIDATPDPLTFPAEGGSENLAVSSNMPVIGIKLTKNTDKDSKPWVSCKLSEDLAKTAKLYSVEVEENKTPATREAIITIEALRGDGKTETKEIAVTQEASLDGVLSLSTYFLYLPGYSLMFNDGHLAVPVTATYIQGATLKLESSDKTWLNVIEDGPATASNVANMVQQKYKITVTPNPSFKTPNYGIISAELIQPNGDIGHTKIHVTQTPLLNDITFIPEKITLMADEYDGAEYSDTGEAFIESILLDDGLKPYISKQEVIPDDDWIDKATVADRKIEVRAKAYSDEEKPRTGSATYRITLTSGESAECPLPVVQREKGAYDLFTINPRRPGFPPEGGSITVDIVGDNVDREHSPHTFSIISGPDGFGGVCRSDVLSLLAEPTSVPEERYWQFRLEVTMKDGTKVQRDFVAFQEPLGDLTLSPSEVFSTRPGGVFEVDVDMRGNYEKLRISSDANWCKPVLMDWHKAELAIDENPVSELRRATVTVEFVADNGAVLRTATVQVVQEASDEGSSQPTVEEDQLLFNSWKHSDDTNSGYYLQVKFGTDGTYLEVYATPQKVTTLGDGIFSIMECVRNTKPEYYSEGREWMFAVLKNYDYFIRYKISRNYKNEKGKSFSDEKYAWVTPDGRYLVFCDEIYNAEEGAQATTYSISKRFLTFTAEGGSEIVEVKNYGKGKLGVRVNDAYKGWLTAEVVDGGIRITTLKNTIYYTSPPGPHYHNGMVTIFCTDENGKEYITENVIVNQEDNLCEHLMITGAKVILGVPGYYLYPELWTDEGLYWLEYLTSTYSHHEFRENCIVNGTHIELSRNAGKNDYYKVSFDIDNFSDDINVGLSNSRSISNLKIEGVYTYDGQVRTFSVSASNIRHESDHSGHYYSNKETGLSLSKFSAEGTQRSRWGLYETKFYTKEENLGYIGISIGLLPIP